MKISDQIAFIGKRARFPVKWEDFLNCGISIFPAAILYYGYLVIHTVLTIGDSHLLFPGIAIIVGGLLMLRFTIGRLIDNIRFDSYFTGLPAGVNLKVARQVLQETFHPKQTHSDNELGWASAETAISIFSWGEEVSIVCIEDKVLINSRPKQPITILKDRKNVRKVKEGFDEQLRRGINSGMRE